MKKIFLLSAIALVAFVSCSDDDDPKVDIPFESVTNEVSVDATSSTTWHYYSFTDDKWIGEGEQTDTDDASWFARTDWDIAINRYHVRTNSGASTSVGAQGGFYECDASTTFESLTKLPTGLTYEVDQLITSTGMSGTTTVAKSGAVVTVFKTNEDGSMIMPPVYLKAPIYLFRTADGQSYFKVEFTQYKNDSGDSGYVKFNAAEIQ